MITTPHPTDGYENLLKRTAQKYLGHDYYPLDHRIAMTSTPDLSRVIITPLDATEKTIHAQDEESCERALSADLGLQLATPSGGAVGFKMDGRHETGHQQGNYSLYVVRAVNVRCALSGGGAEGDGKPLDACYLTGGKLSIGYVITVRVNTSQDSKELKASLSASVPDPLSMLLTAQVSGKAGTSRTKSTEIVNIEVRGLGGYVPSTPNPEEGETNDLYLRRIRREVSADFESRYQTLEPGFTLQENDVMPYQPTISGKKELLAAYIMVSEVLEDVKHALGGGRLSHPDNAGIVQYSQLSRLQNVANENILLLKGLAYCSQTFTSKLADQLFSLRRDMHAYFDMIRTANLIAVRHPICIKLKIKGAEYGLGEAVRLSKGLTSSGRFCTLTPELSRAMKLRIELVSNEDQSLFLTKTEQAFFLTTQRGVTQYLKVSRFKGGTGIALVAKKEKATRWSLTHPKIGYAQGNELMSTNRVKQGFIICDPQERGETVLCCTEHQSHSTSSSCSISFEAGEAENLNHKLESYMHTVHSETTSIETHETKPEVSVPNTPAVVPPVTSPSVAVGSPTPMATTKAAPPVMVMDPAAIAAAMFSGAAVVGTAISFGGKATAVNTSSAHRPEGQLAAGFVDSAVAFGADATTQNGPAPGNF